jgi:hypothetical protein
MASYEIVGVRALHWARDTRSPRISVVIDAGRLAGRRLADVKDTARFLSGDGNDPGMVDFWPGVGGGVMVRKAGEDGGAPVAFYVGGKPAKADWPPFADMATPPDPGYKDPRSVAGMTADELAAALTDMLIIQPADYREAVLAEAAARLRGQR